MSVSEKVIDALRQVYNNHDCITESGHLEYAQSLGKQLVICLNKENFIVPTIIREHVLDSLSDNIYNNSNIDKTVFPLRRTKWINNTDEIKTFDSALKTFFTTRFERKLEKLKIKGDTFYGGAGLILDNNMNPLLMCGQEVKVTTINENKKIIINRPICIISPLVFTDPNNVINKGIIKKIIPFYSTNFVYTYSSAILGVTVNKTTDTVKIIIDYMDDFFQVTTPPVISDNINDDLNNCIIENIEDIKDFFKF